MIDPKAEPIGHRPPYKPIDVSGRKPAPQPPTAYEAWVTHFSVQETVLGIELVPHTFVLRTSLPVMNWRKAIITREDVERGEIPDMDLYEYWVGDQEWRLKPALEPREPK